MVAVSLALLCFRALLSFVLPCVLIPQLSLKNDRAALADGNGTTPMSQLFSFSKTLKLNFIFSSNKLVGEYLNATHRVRTAGKGHPVQPSQLRSSSEA